MTSRTSRTPVSLLAAAVVTAACCTGCAEEEFATRTCGVVVDVSGSSDGGRVVERAPEWIAEFLDSATATDARCGELVVTVAIHNSEALTCDPVALEFGGGSEANIRARIDSWERSVAESGFVPAGDGETPSGSGVAAWEELRSCGVRMIEERSDQDNRLHSDVLGALRHLGDLMGEEVQGSRIAVVSDGEHNTEVHFGELDLSSTESRAEEVGRLREGGLLPDLSGSEVVFYGLGSGLEGAWTSSEVTRLEEFWHEIAAAAGAAEVDGVAVAG